MNIQLPAKILSVVALAGTLLPSILFFYGAIGLDTAKSAMLVAMIAWFVVAPLWMNRAPAASAPGE